MQGIKAFHQGYRVKKNNKGSCVLFIGASKGQFQVQSD